MVSDLIRSLFRQLEGILAGGTANSFAEELGANFQFGLTRRTCQPDFLQGPFAIFVIARARGIQRKDLRDIFSFTGPGASRRLVEVPSDGRRPFFRQFDALLAGRALNCCAEEIGTNP